jgi:hypothetical protein
VPSVRSFATVTRRLREEGRGNPSDEVRMSQNVAPLATLAALRSRHARSSWLRLGPGLGLAAVLAAILWLNVRPEKPAAMPAEHPSLHGGPAERSPEVSLLLEHAADLTLTPRQQVSLAAVDREWREVSTEFQEDIATASRQFDGYMRTGHQTGGRLPAAVQRSAAATAQLTQSWLARRAQTWERGLDLLTPSQRALAEALGQQQE